MSIIAYALIVVGYGLLYTGLMDFSGNHIGLFQVFGVNSGGITIESSQFSYQNPVANMTSQPALYTLNNGLTGSVSV